MQTGLAMIDLTMTPNNTLARSMLAKVLFGMTYSSSLLLLLFIVRTFSASPGQDNNKQNLPAGLVIVLCILLLQSVLSYLDMHKLSALTSAGLIVVVSTALILHKAPNNSIEATILAVFSSVIALAVTYWPGDIGSILDTAPLMLVTTVLYFEFSHRLSNTKDLSPHQVYLLEQSQWCFFLYILFHLIADYLVVDTSFYLVFGVAALALLSAFLYLFYQNKHTIRSGTLLIILVNLACLVPSCCESFMLLSDAFM